MKLLLDTQIFLWFISGDKRLREIWKEKICDSNNDVYLSVVSLWEITIKYQLQKLPLPQSPESYIPAQRKRHNFSGLSLDEASVLNLNTLPPIHRDPFDRMLICQALEHDLTIVTSDKTILKYSVQVLGNV